MPEKFWCKFMIIEFRQTNLQSGNSCIFHSRYTICVACDKNDSINGSLISKVCDIQTYPHIDALLFEIGLEIVIRQRSTRDRNTFRLEAPKFQNTDTGRKEIFPSKRLKPSVRSLEFMHFAGNRLAGLTCKRSAIVIEGSKQRFTIGNARMRNLFDEVGIIVKAGLLREHAQMTTVDQNRYFHTLPYK